MGTKKIFLNEILSTARYSKLPISIHTPVQAQPQSSISVECALHSQYTLLQQMDNQYDELESILYGCGQKCGGRIVQCSLYKIAFFFFFFSWSASAHELLHWD